MLLKKAKELYHLIKKQYKARLYNNLPFQRSHWKEELAKYDWNLNRLYGYEWGDPEDPNDRWGNYLEVKNRILSLLNPEKTILEIGSLGGKWTQYFLEAKNIICVDINELGFEYIRKKLPCDKISFYLTKGDELRGIENSSMDIVFSMDTLVRSPKKIIYSYIKEAGRVLRPYGQIFLHLPCKEIKGSRDKAFVGLTLKEIINCCKKNAFEIIRIDKELIKHEVILQAAKQKG